MERLVVWCESSMWVVEAIKGLEDLSLVNKFFMALEVLLIVVGRSFVLIATEEMSGSGVTEPFLHIIRGNSLEAGLDVALLIPCVVYLVLKLLHVFKLGIFP